MTQDTQDKQDKQGPKPDRLAALDNYRFYTLTEIEPVIGVTHRTLLNYVKDKRLKCVKVGGRWKISGQNLQRFLDGE
jgi:excisionase family DNA binding protein